MKAAEKTLGIALCSERESASQLPGNNGDLAKGPLLSIPNGPQAQLGGGGAGPWGPSASRFGRGRGAPGGRRLGSSPRISAPGILLPAAAAEGLRVKQTRSRGASLGRCGAAAGRQEGRGCWGARYGASPNGGRGEDAPSQFPSPSLAHSAGRLSSAASQVSAETIVAAASHPTPLSPHRPLHVHCRPPLPHTHKLCKWEYKAVF